MGLVIDTAQLDSRDRIDAVNAALSTTEVPHVITHPGVGGEVHHRLDAWELGYGCHLLQASGSELRLVRTAQQLKISAPQRLSLAIQLHRPGVRSHCGAEENLAVGDLILTDQTSCHDYRWERGGGSRTFVVDYQMAGISVDVVRRAVPSVRRSPLYSLLQAQLTGLCPALDDITGSPAANMVGAATTELLRALVITAVEDDARRQHEVMSSTLLLRIKHFLECHLTDPALNVQMIAYAHNVSVRQVYQVWAHNELALGQWIIRARLEGARRELARPGRASAVAGVARRWGFVDPGHFSRRFRAEFGMSPRDWQYLNTSELPPGR